MSEIISDPLWRFIGVILPIITIATMVIICWIQRQKRALSWQVVSNTPLLSIDKEIKGNLEVLYNKKPVQGVQLIIAKIINTGNVPIKSSDYERPINFNFGENAQILTAEVTETSVDSLKASINIEGKKVILKSLMRSLARSTNEPVVGYAKRQPSAHLGKFYASMGADFPYVNAAPQTGDSHRRLACQVKLGMKTKGRLGVDLDIKVGHNYM